MWLVVDVEETKGAIYLGARLLSVGLLGEVLRGGPEAICD